MAGRTLGPIRERYGDFDRWFQERPGVPATYQVHALDKGAPVPPVAESDGWVITGSPDSVNDGQSWLPAARKQIAQAVDVGHPILGVCFGHQLLAVSTGGQVGLNPRGWELGPAEVELTQRGVASVLFSGMGRTVPVYESHKEVVSMLPTGAEVLASNEMGLQAFQIGPAAFGVQFHPEFTDGIARMYVEIRSAGRSPLMNSNDQGGEQTRQVLTNFIQFLRR